MKQRTIDREFYSLVFKISLPIAGQNLITSLVSTMDTIMLGRLGEVALSAGNLGNQLQFIYMIVVFGIAGGTNVLIAQYWGKGEIEPIHHILSIMYKVVLGFGLLAGCVALFLPEAFLSIYTNDPVVIEAGASYLRILAPSYLMFGITSSTIIMLRSVRTVKISLVVYLTSLCINVFFNWIFIFGHLGAPRMGVAGAAVGTLIARAAELTIAVVFMARFETKIRYRLRGFFHLDRTLFDDYLHVASPVMFNELLWSVGTSMLSIVVGRMGTDVVAANSIASVLNQFVAVMIFGVGNAAAIIIGNTVGEERYELAQQRAVRLLGISLIFGLFACLVTNLVKGYMVQIYAVTDSTRELALQIMTVYSIIVIFQALANTSMVGVLRGGGDVRFVLVTDIIFLWTISIPLGFIAAFWLKLPVAAVFFILRCDEPLKDIFSCTRILRGRWIRNVTR